jgi:hypothetical protein
MIVPFRSVPFLTTLIAGAVLAATAGAAKHDAKETVDDPKETIDNLSTGKIASAMQSDVLYELRDRAAGEVLAGAHGALMMPCLDVLVAADKRLAEFKDGKHGCRVHVQPVHVLLKEGKAKQPVWALPFTEKDAVIAKTKDSLTLVWSDGQWLDLEGFPVLPQRVDLPDEPLVDPIWALVGWDTVTDLGYWQDDEGTWHWDWPKLGVDGDDDDYEDDEHYYDDGDDEGEGDDEGDDEGEQDPDEGSGECVPYSLGEDCDRQQLGWLELMFGDEGNCWWYQLCTETCIECDESGNPYEVDCSDTCMRLTNADPMTLFCPALPDVSTCTGA